MKKIVLLLFVLCLVAQQGRTQDKTKQVNTEAGIMETGLYFKAGLGISFGTHAEILYQTSTTTVNESSSTTTDAIKARLGTGLPFGIAAGYMFNKNFGAELGIDYFQGFNTKILNTRNGDESKTLISAIHLSVVPSVVAKIQVCNMNPYIRVGLDVSVVNQVNTRMTGVTYLFRAAQTGKMNTRDYGGITLGIKVAAGMEFPLSHLISIFGEIQATQISFSPKHGKVTKYEVEGQDMMSTLTTMESKWDYVKSKNSSDATPPDEPNKALLVTHSMDNVGLVVGVKFNFGE